MQKRRVVITGGGVCSSLGDNWEEILKTLYELKKDDLESIGINITLDTLMSYYI